MDILVKKRDGRIVSFDQNKIIDAILAAFKAIDKDISDYALTKAGNIADYIAGQAEQLGVIDIEEIQDMVEHGLMSTRRKDVAKAYILYREERTKVRTRNSKLMKTVAEKLLANNVQNQNANIDEHSFGGRMGEANSALMKQYALDYCLSDMARNNYLNNEIYIHDLDHYAIGDHNCLSIPFDQLLSHGFNTRQTDVRPAQSVSTAFQLVAVIFQLQSLQQFGGVSATHLDWTMVPYVRKSFYKHFKEGAHYLTSCEPEKILEDIDTLSIDSSDYQHFNPEVYQYALDQTEKEVYQAVEGLYHNLN